MSDLGQPEACGPVRWLLLIHQLPAKPAYLRVKIWRRLQALGAVTAKNSVYVLPATEDAQEDFEWLCKEIVEGGGEGMICEAKLIGGLSDEEVQGLFNAAREAEYQAVAEAARGLAEVLRGKVDPAARTDAKARLARHKAEARRIFSIDFFGANGRETAEGLLGAIESQLMEGEEMAGNGERAGPERDALPKGRVWVTRRGVHVDRIASAWFVRRFIDPQARFKFVPPKGYVPAQSELRFDMFEAEFTHEGDHCTFEVLLGRSGLSDPALSAIGQLVHDIDMKDAKFGRAEAAGIAHLIDGIAAATGDDDERLARGAALFDDLYMAYQRRRD